MSRPISGRAAASLVAWLLGVAVATGIGLLAVSLLGDGLTSNSVQPLSRDDVGQALATASPSGTPGASPSGSPGVSSGESRTSPPAKPGATNPPRTTSAPPAQTSVTRSLSSPGGSVVARCNQGGAYLVSWTPNQGYATDDGVVRGPAVAAQVEFRSRSSKVELTVTCPGGVPQATVKTRAEDRNGGGGDDGGRHGGRGGED